MCALRVWLVLVSAPVLLRMPLVECRSEGCYTTYRRCSRPSLRMPPAMPMAAAPPATRRVSTIRGHCEAPRLGRVARLSQRGGAGASHQAPLGPGGQHTFAPHTLAASRWGSVGCAHTGIGVAQPSQPSSQGQCWLRGGSRWPGTVICGVVVARQVPCVRDSEWGVARASLGWFVTGGCVCERGSLASAHTAPGVIECWSSAQC